MADFSSVLSDLVGGLANQVADWVSKQYEETVGSRKQAPQVNAFEPSYQKNDNEWLYPSKAEAPDIFGIPDQGELFGEDVEEQQPESDLAPGFKKVGKVEPVAVEPNQDDWLHYKEAPGEQFEEPDARKVGPVEPAAAEPNSNDWLYYLEAAPERFAEPDVKKVGPVEPAEVEPNSNDWLYYKEEPSDASQVEDIARPQSQDLNDELYDNYKDRSYPGDNRNRQQEANGLEAGISSQVVPVKRQEGQQYVDYLDHLINDTRWEDWVNRGALGLAYPLFTSTPNEKRRAQEAAEYKAEHSIDGAMTRDNGYLETSPEWQQRYWDMWLEEDLKNGIDPDTEGIYSDRMYQSGLDRIPEGLSYLLQDQYLTGLGGDYTTNQKGVQEILGGIGDYADINSYDSGVDNLASKKSKYMSGEEYLKLQEYGFGGRPAYLIDPGASYNKLDEYRGWGFIPYIDSPDQYQHWMFTDAADSLTKAFNLLGQSRGRLTDEYIEFNGQRIEREQFADELEKYVAENEDKGPTSTEWTFTLEDGSKATISVEGSGGPAGGYVCDENGNIFVAMWDEKDPPDIAGYREAYDADGNAIELPVLANSNSGGVYYAWPDEESFMNDFSTGQTEVIEYGNELEYDQLDGEHIKLTPAQLVEIQNGLTDGSVNVDYGPFNIGKDASERKTRMQALQTMDISDFVPNFLDMTAQSSPLFTRPTGYAQSIPNAITATQGLDPRLYDVRHNSYSRVAEDIGADRYMTNILLNLTRPVLEQMMGGIGGGHGYLGNAIAKSGLLTKPWHYAGLDIGGEGVEEVLADPYEDLMTSGWRDWYANPVYEMAEGEDGVPHIVYEKNIIGEDEPKKVYDVTGHEVRDPDTSAFDRIMNDLSGAGEAALGGIELGGALRGPSLISDKINGRGYFAPGAFGEPMKRYTPEDFMEFTEDYFGTYNQSRK